MTPVSGLALEVVYHDAKPGAFAAWVRPLNAAMERYDIVTPERQAAFIAQILYESRGLQSLEESTYYSSAERVALIFKSRVDTNHDGCISPGELADAQRFVRNPTLFANHFYANRLGNGDEASGDGFRYRGRGPIQITGKDNIRACSTSLFNGDASVLLLNPDLLLKPEYGSMSAAWFWWSHGLNELADEGGFRQITKLINGAYTGYAERCELWTTAKQVLV